MSEPATTIMTAEAPRKVDAVCSGKMDLDTAFVSEPEQAIGMSKGGIIDPFILSTID